MRMIEPTNAHQALYLDLSDLLRRHGESASALEILAISAQITGKLIALQDQTKVTKEVAMETVARNIELGNQQVIEALLQSKGGNA